MGDPSAGDTWIVMPTYNEADNLASMIERVLSALPSVTVLVVDDSSPDGTGQLAEVLAGRDSRVKVLHRAGKEGLGPAYVSGFHRALQDGARRVVQMDADGSHDPKYLPAVVGALGDYDLVIGSRYVAGGGVRNWSLARRLISRGGSLFGRVVLGLKINDLTGGFKAWRAEMLARTPWPLLHSGGYVFQIEMTYLAALRGARILEVPIIFADRELGQSKMSKRIIAEAFVVVLQLRWEKVRGRLRR